MVTLTMSQYDRLLLYKERLGKIVDATSTMPEPERETIRQMILNIIKEE